MENSAIISKIISQLEELDRFDVYTEGVGDNTSTSQELSQNGDFVKWEDLSLLIEKIRQL
jgi:hypothetical protein